VLQHLANGFFQFFFVLLRFIAQRFMGHASPKQLFIVSIVEI